MVRRIAKKTSHTIKIRAKVRARGSRQSWAHFIRKKARTQSLWTLQLAGDWHYTHETLPAGSIPHRMHVTIISNLDVDQRFAKGTQGRLLNWHPGATESKRRALRANCPDLIARFCKLISLRKQQMPPDIDMIDITTRQENLNLKSEPITFKLCIVPAYSLRTLGVARHCRSSTSWGVVYKERSNICALKIKVMLKRPTSR